jgi:thiamine kinase-like enzyme
VFETDCLLSLTRDLWATQTPPSSHTKTTQLSRTFFQLASDVSAWIAPLEAGPSVCLHGDLRRANISFADAATYADSELVGPNGGHGDVELFDWEFAARGNPAADFGWHILLHYWGYPPDDGPSAQADSADDLRDCYISAFNAAADGNHRPRIDPASFAGAWRASWARAVVMLGFILVDQLSETSSEGEVQRVTGLIREAVRRAGEALGTAAGT